eukprot:g9802.t1
MCEPAKDLYRPVLKLSHTLAHLPPDSLKALEDEASMYNAGWSHGKEKLGDKPDFAKGSFYFNPLSDTPGTEDDMAKFPWAKCKDLGKVMQEVIGFLGEQVDHVMASKVKTYTANLGKTLRETNKCKGRLLYYFPPKEIAASSPCFREFALSGSEIENPDPEGAGLWIVDRDGAAVRVKIPKDCMAIQVGECTQVVTGGEFVATPHCVRGCRPQYCAGRKAGKSGALLDGLPKARAAGRQGVLPLFCGHTPHLRAEDEFSVLFNQPEQDLIVPQTGRIPDGFSSEAMLAKGVSSKVPPLAERWEPGQSFGDFLGATFKRYYDWALGKTGPPEKKARTA